MTFDPNIFALRVHICFVCFANILGLLYWLFYRRIWINSCLGVMNSIAIVSFCTHLTFDLIPRLRHISRLGIHPYGCWHTSRTTISMDATFYSILPSEEIFHGMESFSASWTFLCFNWAPSSEFVSSSIPSWKVLSAHAQPFRGTRDLAFCLKVPLDSMLVWASSEGSGETARMRRLAWTFAARIGDKYQIRLMRPN